MTASTESQIWQALKARVLTLPLGYSLDWPLDDFIPPASGDVLTPYIEVRPVPNTSARVLIRDGGPMDRIGLLQLTVCQPVAAKDTFEVQQERAGRIAAHFPDGLKLRFDTVTVRITKAPDIKAPYRDNAYLRWPVIISWQCFA